MIRSRFRRWRALPVFTAPLLLALLEGCALASLPAAFASAEHPYGSVAALESKLEAARESAGDRVEVGAGPLLREGDRGERVARLRKRLAASGDLGADPGSGDRFDAATTRAVERFQRRHRLEVDGLVGPGTLRALDVPLDRHLAKLERNLQARRAFARPTRGRYVLVNVPDFRLAWVREGEPPLVMRVAVGQEDWPTTPIDDRIDRLEINPSWYVPARIAAEEIAPKAEEDPEYLDRRGLKVFDGWGEGAEEIDPAGVDWGALEPSEERIHLVQPPGPENPLGRIKFLFPNREDIYLHDTPDRAVFERRDRAVSHGCVRVEEPLDLAAALLEGRDGWSRQRLQRTLERDETTTVELGEGIAIRLVYWTAWVDEDGELQIREDLYHEQVDPTSEPL